MSKPETRALIVSDETVRQSYAESQAKAVGEILWIICQLARTTLTDKLVQHWREALKDLSPSQVREGYMRFSRDPNRPRGFPPEPADIIAYAPEEAKDVPRKVRDPDCPHCQGTGFRTVLKPSKNHEGKQVEAVTDCYCVRIEYQGQVVYRPDRQLAPPKQEPQVSVEEFKRKIAKIAQVPFRESSDEELTQKREKMLKQLQRHLEQQK